MPLGPPPHATLVGGQTRTAASMDLPELCRERVISFLLINDHEYVWWRLVSKRW